MENSIALVEVDGEPRIKDLDLAIRLGFEQERDIRKLIKRHESKLLEFGVCATVAQTSGELGGRPATEFYLNRKQALFICMKSETDNAFEVQADIIRVYDAYLNGMLQQRIPTAPIDFLTAYRLAKRREVAQNYNKMMTAVEHVENLARPLIYPPITDKEFADRVVRSKQWEADMLNRTVMGFTSMQIRQWYDIRTPIRDHLPAKILAALNFLEGHNIAMLYAGVSDEKRQEALNLMLHHEFYDVVRYRDEQVATLNRRFATKQYDIFPLHPMQCPQLHTPNQYMIEFGFTQEQLEQAGNIVFAGEQ